MFRSHRIIHSILPVVAGLVLLVGTVPAQDFRDLHRTALVVDGHNDVLGRVMSGGDMESWGSVGHSDLPRFRAGGIDVQLFSIWVPSKRKGNEAWQYALDEIDSLKAIAARNASVMGIALRGGDIERLVADRKLASVIALEGGRCIDGRRDRIIELYRRGLRCFGLTWNFSSDWATCSQDERAGKVRGGLSKKGKSFVRLLDSLGVLIDVSHLGARSFADVIATTRSPIIASHSGCAALRDHHRNLTDTQLRAIAAGGGVAMMTYVPSFIFAGLDKKKQDRMRAYERQAAELRKNHPDRGAAYLKAYDNMLASARKERLCTIDDVVRHVLHAVNVAGAAHVGLGSDFDGIGLTPVGLHDVTDLPLLTRALRNSGLTDEQIRGILGGNFLRVWNTVVKHGSDG
ncbi:MAG: dipeptidase [Bacteroidetes bacterium]|nr:dipeptidase [Bacteroidota bacterium]